MKVLMINSVCGIRSTGRICTDLAAALEAQGHEVKIAYGREKVPEQFQKYAVRIGSDLDVKLHALRARLFDCAGFGSKYATKKFIKWVKQYNPDVIHLHNIHGYYINAEVLFNYLKTCEKKIIWTLHDCWAFTGHSAYCDAVQCEKWKRGCSKCPQIKEYPKALTDKSEQNWIKKRQIFTGIPNMTIITPSHWLAGLAKESFLKDYPIDVIHNGIDTSVFYPMKNDFRQHYGIGNKFILLGVATSWNTMKGYSDYLKLADLLGDEYKVVLVGLTKEQLKQLPPNILGIERTDSIKELAQIYSEADLYLNLSYCENYPTVNLEAMACGTPVLTYQTGGSPESIINHCGITIPRGDIEAVTKAIRHYAKEPGNKPDLKLDKSEIDDINYNNKYILEYSGGVYWRYKETLGLLGKRVILCVSAIWDKRKGLEDIIKLSKIIDDSIIVVGVTEEQKKLLPANVTGIKRTNNVEELRRLYAVADIFVNPTYEDNYPTTNIEAISCGTPVITYDTGGSPESAEAYGYAVPKGDINAIARLINNWKYPVKSIVKSDTQKFADNYLKFY